MSDPKGIDLKRVSAWLLEHAPGAAGPFEFDLIAAGGSNLSYRVSDAAGVWLLRRGPVSSRLATAHDMGREWRVISALKEIKEVPVPKAFAICEDEAVTGAPFYLMEFVDGRILRSAKDAADMDQARCRRATESLVQVQAAMHTLDVDAVGLGDISVDRLDYVKRQLKRWRKQLHSSSRRELPLAEEIYSHLLSNAPEQSAPPALVHGDYRFDNTVLADDDSIKAVLDWELSAIGDPVADFFWSLLYWGRRGEKIIFFPDAPTFHEPFAEREAVIDMYQNLTGFDLSARAFFEAFGAWKMACIVEGVSARLRAGAGGGMKVSMDHEVIEAGVDNYLKQAAALC